MSRYYPGFLGALCIVLLRIAIGWHFLYEGWEKVESHLEGKEPFSAEIYVRNATGPFAPYFRQMVPDADGLALLDQDRLKEAWKEDVARLSNHYQLPKDQQTQAQKILDESLQWADYWFADPANAEKRAKYIHDLSRIEQTEGNPQSLSFQTERARDARPAIEADRRALTRPLLEQEKTLHDAVVKLAKPEQAKSLGDPGGRWSSLDVINAMTMVGLVAIGTCLILGFLTPLAALSGAAFLAMIYFSMPPWPGLPANPRAEGHYLIVSKNLIEMLACLVIATTPSGHWIGFDALFFGARRRRRLAGPAVRQEEREARPAGRGRQVEPIREEPIALDLD